MPENRSTDQGHRPPTDQGKTTYTDLEDGGLAGNLTRDPELRFTPAGRALATLRVAESHREQDAVTQQWHDTAPSFHDVIVWGKPATHVVESLTKGARIVAIGRWQKQEWDDREGNHRSKRVLQARELGVSLTFGALPAAGALTGKGEV